MIKFYYKKEKLLEKIQIAESTYILKYSVDPHFTFIPGQYVGIQVAPTWRRAYSIYKQEPGILWFLIDTKPGGIASKFFDEVEVGAENLLVGPYGKFFLEQTKNKKVFIGTGTGIAPFYPMVAEMKHKDNYDMQGVEADFLFGCRFFEDEVSYNFFEEYIDDSFRYIQCITKEENPDAEKFPKAYFFNGRVTAYLQQHLIEYPKATEFYICGNPDMVEDVKLLLTMNGYTNVLGEKYG
jgi:all-trans-retinol 13,14-reductase